MRISAHDQLTRTNTSSGVICSDTSTHVTIDHTSEGMTPSDVSGLCPGSVSSVHSPDTVSQSDPDTPGRVTVLTRPSIPTRQRPHPAVMTVNMAGMWALHGLTHRQTDINTGLYADIGARGCHIRPTDAVTDLQHTSVTGVTQTDTQTHR